MRAWLTLSLLLFIPTIADAAVTINEIAWMGSSDSVNHEWIELRNDSSNPVSVDDWTLSDGDSLNISLAGVVPSNAHIVLERTSEDSAPGPAFLIYTGALKNTGATLSLRRSDGGLEDQVAGGEDWENIGGDNTTKDTAQYTSGGWVTAQPTPGASNQTEATSTAETTTRNTTSGGTSARLAEPVEREPLTLSLPGVTLQLAIVAPQQAFVNQPIDFKVRSSGVGPTIENSLQYQWNFGDLITATDKEPTHTFLYPGTYVVHAHAEFGRQAATDTHEITVLPIALSLTQNRSGDVQINNDSPYAVDLSAFRLRAREAIDIPPNTQLLPQQTITVAVPTLGATHNQLIALYDQMGELVDSIVPSTLAAQTVTTDTPAPVRSQTAPKRVSAADNQRFQFASASAPPTVTQSANREATLQSATPVSQSDERNPTDWTWLALIGLLSLACVVVLMQPFILKHSEQEHE